MLCALAAQCGASLNASQILLHALPIARFLNRPPGAVVPTELLLVGMACLPRRRCPVRRCTQTRDDTEAVSLLRTQVEQSRQRAEDSQPAALDTGRNNAPSAFSLGLPSPRCASFTPLTGTFAARFATTKRSQPLVLRFRHNHCHEQRLSAARTVTHPVLSVWLSSSSTTSSTSCAKRSAP
ncbi:hypothetical protein B0H12DRAFT_539947 [Mycena haematopus]|nr:hypothetical protein B0H12DRAFT_539947 [Mycena haematopus]